MYNLIQAVYQSPLKHKLWFKWWTLCLFLHSLNRFSTDLDFDVLWDVEAGKDTMMSEIRDLILKYGKLTIKDEHNKKFTYFFLLNYGEDQKNIKFEVSKRKIALDTYSAVNFFWTNILAMTKDAIFANKLLAISSRYKNRDLFDIYFFFKEGFPINEKIIEAKSGKSIQDFLLYLKETIPNKYSEKTVLAEIGDLIDEKQKYFMKYKIIWEVISYIDFYLSSS